MEKKKKTKKSSKLSGFRFLEHTADIMVQAWGPDYLAALGQAAMAMFSVLGEAKPEESFEVEERASKRDELVVSLLSRILAECDAREIVASRMDVLEYDEKAVRIRARVFGARSLARDAIKAVTFHRLEVKEGKNKCTIQVVFDV
jgi:SHS2 domain-containing protein